MDINKFTKKYEEYVKLKLRQKLLEKDKLLKEITQKDKENSKENIKTFQDKLTNNEITEEEIKDIEDGYQKICNEYNNELYTDNCINKKLNIEEAMKEPNIWKQVNNMIKECKMNYKTIYVTSFNKDMYLMSGQLLIDTFIKNNPKDFLVVCYEGMKFQRKCPQIIPFNLSQSKFLREWLIKNADNIPSEYGGTATKFNNPKLYKNYFNKSASKWFRKIVSIDMTIKTYGQYFKYVVWIDADCYARKPLPIEIMDKIFKNNDVIYHLSKKRIYQDQGIESGIIGFKKGKGYDFMDIVSHKFKSGDFKKYSRWDDGWVFREVVDELTEKYKDIKRKVKKQKEKIEIENQKLEDIKNEVKTDNKTNNNISIKDKGDKDDKNNKIEDEYENLDDIIIDEIKMLDLVGNTPVTQILKSEVIPHGPFKNYYIHDKGKHNGLRGAKVKPINFNKV
jgi:hypothetical protein